MMSIDEIMKAGERNKARDTERAIERACKVFGFNPKGWVWLLLDEMPDYETKETFKDLGGLYDKVLGWHSTDRIEGFKMKKVAMDTLGEVVNGVWQTRRYKVDVARKTACRAKLGKRKLASEFVGIPGVNAGLVTKVRLASVKESMFRDSNYDLPEYYGLPFRWDYTFKDKAGNIIVFSSAYYRPKMVQEWFGKGWANLTAKVISHDDRHGTKITKIIFPEFTKNGKLPLKACARIPNPREVGEMPLEMIECDS